MANLNGPGNFTFDSVTGALLTTTAGGGTATPVNITQILGAPVAMSNSLPVELSDGTNPFGTAGNPLSENIAQWAGTAVSVPVATAPVGTETAPVVRPIQRKITTTLTTTPLAGGATFNSPAADTNLDGTTWVEIEINSDQSSAASGAKIQQSDDSTNWLTTAVMTFSLTQRVTLYGPIIKRYWRVQFVNGATLQGSFSILATTCNVPPTALSGMVASGANGAYPLPWQGGASAVSSNQNQGWIPYLTSSASFNGDGQNANAFFNGGGATGMLPVMICATTGNQTSGAFGAVIRTPNKFFSVQATASGNTAVWTPTTGKKFRLMRYFIEVTANSSVAAAVVVQITFQDATTDMGHGHSVFVPTAAVLTGGPPLLSGSWIDLGNGILSAAANNVLNINLDTALATGRVRVTVCGTEE